ncbi:hypothetical protein CERSUDRAFT_88274 [Gelatoporia subvermispora B]|uniref:Uncharacterized protein n=1 Tax=Ceriporiopsis subvermispora (strain B) TaxID=914234 RepID=M2QJI7_CERS8|nr:hypothetical protein CERSUDRAFT_88274 [Gelatoporia subvermispora B]
MITLVMGVIGTLDASLTTAINIRAWSTGDLTQFINSSWMNDVKMVDQVLMPLIGDAMLTYRCWIVYEHSWRAIIPSSLLWLVGFGLCIVLNIKAAVLTSAVGINDPSLTPYIASLLAITVVQNILTTSLIIHRIWSVQRDIRRHGVLHGNVIFIVRTIVESGVLYTSSAVILLGTAVVRNNADYITGDALVQITGIAFNLIIIRFDQSLADRYALPSPASDPNITTATTTRELPHMQIYISRQTEIATESACEKVDTAAYEL